jgi:hypothetical protein
LINPPPCLLLLSRFLSRGLVSPSIYVCNYNNWYCTGPFVYRTIIITDILRYTRALLNRDGKTERENCLTTRWRWRNCVNWGPWAQFFWGGFIVTVTSLPALVLLIDNYIGIVGRKTNRLSCIWCLLLFLPTSKHNILCIFYPLRIIVILTVIYLNSNFFFCNNSLFYYEVRRKSRFYSYVGLGSYCTKKLWKSIALLQ